MCVLGPHRISPAAARANAHPPHAHPPVTHTEKTGPAGRLAAHFAIWVLNAPQESASAAFEESTHTRNRAAAALLCLLAGQKWPPPVALMSRSKFCLSSHVKYMKK
jgi:hypothetical protein